MKILVDKSRMGEITPYAIVMFIHSIYAAYFLLSKVAFDGGMSTTIFVFYRQAAAALILSPIAFFSQRETSPPLTLMICFKIFMLALIGITTSLNLYAIALKFTSAGVVVAAGNSLPVIVFFIAFILKMEKVNLRKTFGILKLAGVVFCVAGVATMAFYKGPNFKLLMHHHIFNYAGQEGQRNAHNNNKSWVIGIFVVLLSNIFWGLWMVLQAKFLETYPEKLCLTALQTLFSTFQSFIVAISVERNLNEWKLGWNERLAAIAYCAIMVTGVTYYLQAWVLQKKGPVFVGMMNPVVTLITVPASAICFGEVVSLGTVIGTLLLLGGLYSVLWGQAKEKKMPPNSIGIEPPVMSSPGEADIELNAVKDGENMVNGT